jgi:molybdate transport system ATP-binding protein
MTARSLTARLTIARHDFTLDVDLEAHRGRTLVLAGPNGAGKTSIVECIAGVRSPDRGRIRLDDRVLHDSGTGANVPPELRRVGVVFQAYLLFPHLSVLDNVAFGPRAGGLRRSEARDRAAAWLDRFGLSALAGRRPDQVSGGQAQRVALARALATEPDVLLLDEPLAALDVDVRHDVRSELALHLGEFSGITVIVTHDLADLRALGDDVVLLESGRITQRATVPEFLAGPTTEYGRRLVNGR